MNLQIEQTTIKKQMLKIQLGCFMIKQNKISISDYLKDFEAIKSNYLNMADD